MPCFAGAAHLREACASLAAQTFGEKMQLCFADDGSPDDSWEEFGRCAREIFGSDARFLVSAVRLPKNVGAGGARNACLERALGDYYCFLDCDDVMEPNRVSRAAEAEASNAIRSRRLFASLLLFSSLPFNRRDASDTQLSSLFASSLRFFSSLLFSSIALLVALLSSRHLQSTPSLSSHAPLRSASRWRRRAGPAWRLSRAS